jgi:predicted transcriptional regulator
MLPELHYACGLFPQMAEAELAKLSDDIKVNGLREPIVLMADGALLDGRNRWLACERASVEPRTVVHDGSDPVRFVISKNLTRRHLDTGQRSMVAARLANMVHGGDRRSDQSANLRFENEVSISQSDAAELLNVSRRSVQNAKEVIAEGISELVAAVDGGKIRLGKAAKIAKLPKENQVAAMTSKKERPQHRNPDITPVKEQQIAAAVLDDNKTQAEVALEFGVSNTVVKVAVAKERGRREPNVSREELSLTAQQKLDTAIRQKIRQLDVEFERRVQAEIRRYSEEILLPHVTAREMQANQIIKTRKGIMTRDVYRLILGCLHPDRLASGNAEELKNRYERAFNAFTKLELVLCNESEVPRSGASALPRTWDEMQKAKEAASARRRSGRSMPTTSIH